LQRRVQKQSISASVTESGGVKTITWPSGRISTPAFLAARVARAPTGREYGYGRRRDRSSTSSTLGLTDFGRKLTEKLSDSKMSDNDKLLYVTSLAPDPEAFWKPVSEFVDRIKDDQESKELFKLYIQDELSSGKWLMYACEALNGPAKAPSAQMGVSAGEAL
jgi:hypothetical protein